MVEMSTRWLGFLALLALIPVVTYLVVEEKLVVVLAIVNVLLIATALYTFLGPSAEDAHSSSP